MNFMLLLLIFILINAVMSIVVRKSEEVKAIFYEYNDTPILRFKQQFNLSGNVTVQNDPKDGNINFLNIEYRKKGDEEYHMFDTLDFKHCKARESFYCVQDKKTYLIYFNTTIVVEFNQSGWRMHGSYNGYEFSSNAVILPIVQPNVEVNLFKFNQSYSKCEQDILVNEEIFLQGHARFHGNFEEDEMSITIEQKLISSTNYNLYSTINLNRCETSYFMCTREGDLNSYTLTLSLNATKELSESHWRLAGQFMKTPYQSTPVQLPRILDLSKVLMRLNGQTLSRSNTSIAIKEDEDLFLCCDIAPSPCVAVITVNHIQSFSNLSCVSHQQIKSDKSTYTFGYIVCGDNKYSHEFPVDINIDALKDTTEGVSQVIILCALFGTIGLIVLIFLIYIYCCLKEKNQEQNATVKKSLLPPLQDNASPVDRSSVKVEIPESTTLSGSENKEKDNSIKQRFIPESEIKTQRFIPESEIKTQRFIPESEIKTKMSAATAKDVKKNQ